MNVRKNENLSCASKIRPAQSNTVYKYLTLEFRPNTMHENPNPKIHANAHRRRNKPNWLLLSQELWFIILSKLYTIDIVENVEKVCRLFRKVCMQPSMFRVIKIALSDDAMGLDYDVFIRYAVDRSDGGLVDVFLDYCDDTTLSYIAHRSKNLKHLRLGQNIHISDDVLIEAVSNLSMLEEVEITLCDFQEETYGSLGQACTSLKSFSLNDVASRRHRYLSNGEAFAIAKNMPNLRRLQLIGNSMSNKGLKAILRGCPLLESLDLRACFNIELSGALGERCGKIKHVRRPDDSTADYNQLACIDDDCTDDSCSEEEYESDNSDYNCDYDSDVECGVFPNWLELPEAMWFVILSKLYTTHIIEHVQYVCKLFRKLCIHPSMFRTINMKLPIHHWKAKYNVNIMTRYAVDRSAGELVDIYVERCDYKTLTYIAERSKNLKHLRMGYFYLLMPDHKLIEAVKMLPMLEEVEIFCCNFSGSTLEAVGHACPSLKSFSFNNHRGSSTSYEDNEEALAIAKSMPNLRRLHLIWNFLTNEGLVAILDGCPLLEYLDLRNCYKIDLSGDLGKRCNKIKHFRRPNDSTTDNEDYSGLGRRDDDSDDGESSQYSYGYDDYLDDVAPVYIFQEMSDLSDSDIYM